MVLVEMCSLWWHWRRNFRNTAMRHGRHGPPWAPWFNLAWEPKGNTIGMPNVNVWCECMIVDWWCLMNLMCDLPWLPEQWLYLSLSETCFGILPPFPKSKARAAGYGSSVTFWLFFECMFMSIWPTSAVCGKSYEVNILTSCHRYTPQYWHIHALEFGANSSQQQLTAANSSWQVIIFTNADSVSTCNACGIDAVSVFAELWLAIDSREFSSTSHTETVVLL